MSVTTSYNSAVGADATKATPPQDGNSMGVKITGAFTGSFTPEATQDGLTFDPVEAFPIGGGAAVAVFTAPGAWRVRMATFAAFRVRATALSAGTPTVTLSPDEGTF